jgi:hypothetical protein
MSPLWWIVIAAAAILAGVFIWDAIGLDRGRSRCWWCGAQCGKPHQRGCQAEPRL